MDYVIAISGFLGAWLLVAGPVYQAALEVKEQQTDRDKIDAVAHVLTAGRNEKHRRAVFAAITPEHITQTVVVVDKARGAFFTVFSLSRAEKVLAQTNGPIDA
jgi:hypothetical protein